MSVDTKLYLNGHVKPETLLKVIQRKFDPKAEMRMSTSDYSNSEDMRSCAKRCYRSDKKLISTYGTIHFQYENEPRVIVYIYNAFNCYENLDYYTQKGLKKMVKLEKTYLSLGCWGNSVEIMTQILNEFEGGWLDENDCDDIPYKWVPAIKESA